MAQRDTNGRKRTMPQPDYQSLAELRYQIRRFLHFSEEAARKANVEPCQHQFLLALKGLPENMRPTIGILADRLQIRPHSAVELVNRLSNAGLVKRRRDRDDGREVLLEPTAKGEAVLRNLSLHHRAELQTAGPALMAALQGVLKPIKPRQGTIKEQ
jgi:DNA-binding MarR family transcriptional regulator